MEFKENKNNYYTKELNKLDRYLLRIIKRYFDLEEINNAASINAIIAEAITRYKSSILYKNAGVNTLNNKFGIVNINITDLNGEKLFEKLSAFNKDFGTNQDNICMGNDERLSDKRTPKEHHHKILDVTELEEILNEIKKELGKYGYHLHANMAILNKLKYTGVKTQIDLKELENLDSIITVLLNTLETKKHVLINMYKSDMFNNLINQTYLFMQNVYVYIENSNKSINNILVDYINQKENELETIKENIENNYPNIEDLLLVSQAINNMLLLISTQEIDIAETLGTIEGTVSSDNGDTMKDMYDNSSVIGIANDNINIYSGTDKTDRWTYDNILGTFKCNVNESEHLMFLSSNKYKNYTHEVTLASDNSDNDVITIIMAVNEFNDGIKDYIYTLTLNVSIGLDSFTNSPHKLCVLYGYQTWLQDELAYDDTFNPLESEWNNNKIKIKIERNNSIFNIYRSELNSDTLNPIPCITLDISDIYEGILNKPSKYGYGCFSQKDSKFLDVNFIGYKDIELSDNVEQEQDIDFSSIPSDYVADSIEIEPELVYNNTRTKLPYITEDYVISAGTTNNKLYAKFQPLKPGVVLPLDISIGKILYNIYSKRNII
jgi:hypothetical protein